MNDQQIKSLRHSTAVQMGREAVAMDASDPAKAYKKRLALDNAAKLYNAAHPAISYVEAYKAIGGK